LPDPLSPITPITLLIYSPFSVPILLGVVIAVYAFFFETVIADDVIQSANVDVMVVVAINDRPAE
jgi:hypothetical protein